MSFSNLMITDGPHASRMDPHHPNAQLNRPQPTTQQPWAVAAAARVRSGRLIDHLMAVRAAATAHPAAADGERTVGQLVAGIDDLTSQESRTEIDEPA